MTNNFFSETLLKASGRIAQSATTAKILLDKNEQADDVDASVKMKMMESLLQTNWNRYPSADYSSIESKIANYCNLNPENILLGSGSANIITVLLNYFALQNKKITIAQPSYSLFDYHCKTYNIKYTPWYLNADLEFDYANMPLLDQDSVMIITSPNNPVGNTVDLQKMIDLLEMYPDSYIILDNVYSEFCDIDYTPLINKYQNLIILRSFSKAFPVAGLRLGYLCGSPATVAIIRKLILQFSITPFSLVFANEILFDPEFIEDSRQRVKEIIYQREKLSSNITVQFGHDILTVYPSKGNFLLIRIHDDKAFNNLMEDLAEAGIRVMNTSSFSLLKNTFRVSIGTGQENTCFLNCIKNSQESNMLANQMLEALAKRA